MSRRKLDDPELEKERKRLFQHEGIEWQPVESLDTKHFRGLVFRLVDHKRPFLKKSKDKLM